MSEGIPRGDRLPSMAPLPPPPREGGDDGTPPRRSGAGLELRLLLHDAAGAAAAAVAAANVAAGVVADVVAAGEAAWEGFGRSCSDCSDPL